MNWNWKKKQDIHHLKNNYKQPFKPVQPHPFIHDIKKRGYDVIDVNVFYHTSPVGSAEPLLRGIGTWDNSHNNSHSVSTLGPYLFCYYL